MCMCERENKEKIVCLTRDKGGHKGINSRIFFFVIY